MASTKMLDAAGMEMDEEALLVHSRRSIPSGSVDCFWLWALYRVAREAGRREATIARAIKMDCHELMGCIDALFAVQWAQIKAATHALNIGLKQIQETASVLRAQGKLPNINYERRRSASRSTVVATPKVPPRRGRQPNAPYPMQRIDTTSEP